LASLLVEKILRQAQDACFGRLQEQSRRNGLKELSQNLTVGKNGLKELSQNLTVGKNGLKELSQNLTVGKYGLKGLSRRVAL